MAKFAKLFENEHGEQLLLCVKKVDNDEEEKQHGVNFTFEIEEATVDVCISPMTYEKALEFVTDFTQESAGHILINPLEYFTNL